MRIYKNIFDSIASVGYLFFLAILFSSIYTAKVHSEDDKKKDPMAGGQGAVPVIKPLPRHFSMPPVTYGKEPSVEGEKKLDFSNMRFWYVVVIASWNPRSEEISDVLNKNYKIFVARKVGVLALFSQDTESSVAKWRKKIIPQFMNEFASRDFLDAMKNPRVPTVWLVGSEGEILQRLEMPTKEEMAQSVNKVMILTGF
ncbi:hypothetical protein [Fluviispira multicolorata]|uniref:Uncharacterized protein n=1 Tax=Fluviispira multicolorata TaxID=2654512 RepID=A0A833JBT9_9BACT|nr:hypothetical protein [Fluviispira multicolorata]KAB8029768.1 hypothetical protein GCL57_09505 [Fluviispira multicolorata]